MNAPFRFTTCRAGSEAALKRDIARHFGGKLSPAFMKPQFITWKVHDPAFRTPPSLSPFARVSGTSLGLCKTIDELVDFACHLATKPVRLHVFPRLTPEDGVSAADWQRIDTLAAKITQALQQAGVQCTTRLPYVDGDLILDVIVGETEAEPLFAGWHTHQAGLHTEPGGLPRITLPDEVPSRAWLKLEQALAWRGWDKLNLRGQTALDLGSAPGGATFSLLSRGMNVIGVDTGEMDARVFRLAETQAAVFEHWRVAAGKIDLPSLPQVDLLLCDINLAPNQVLPMIERIQRHAHVPRLILTLKLNTPALEDQACHFIEAARHIAPAPVFATQLAGNRREICVCAG
ncbi:MAG: hypothetical protein IAE77_25435 [Prosthecobacter sp.]|jgi:23S rRNA (cytidine2498-2'-O)-methyltransferase|uniref:SAM-dependent methyltransferase n=1 Tax=Prosthecobacter sp. TaxID=1965333 RepID=UPI0019E0F576|nr:SAM-dependent methyltransferase [Prosthecobacter sp.]MBE2286825.1 hypothetical protein [Prosthecobacter sp.]